MTELINEITQGDAIENMRKLADNSVDLIVIDPPYNIGKDKRWDKWKTVDAYVEFMGEVFAECERVLKPTGSFYWFHNDMEQIARLMQEIGTNTTFLYNSFITWDKGNWRSLSWKNPSDKSNLRSWFSTAEYILMYTFQSDNHMRGALHSEVNMFEPIFRYFSEEQEKTGLNNAQLDEVMGRKSAFSYFKRKTSHGIEFPTKELYLKLQKTGYFSREYEDIRGEFESIKREYEKLRYTHNTFPEHKNVWQYRIENKGKLHACQKPLTVIERIIRTSSNEGDIVLDCFGGSGTTAVAAVNTGRNYVLIEREPEYCEIARKRVADALQAK